MRPTSWLRCYHPNPSAAVRLVCFPHAGGTAGYFREWSALLRNDLRGAVEVYAVQYPGREDRFAEGCITDMASFADGAAASVAPLLDRPVALFGHSLGAVVAFEVAMRLRPGAVQHLFASARNAPHDPTVSGDVHLRDDAGLVAELRRLAGTDGGVLDHPDLLPLVLPAVRADHQVIETYVGAPGRAVDCPITVLLGADDTEVTPAEAALWAECTRDRFEVLTYPGGHFYLDDVRPDVIAAVAARMGTAAAWPSTP